MHRTRRLARSARLATVRLTNHLQPHLTAILATILIAVAGGSIALAARTYEPGDQIHVGNTAGSLTTMVEAANHRILIGAGPTRSHSADFVGRSTRPWDRVIDLLVIPGWDDYHAVGALGLLERRGVNGIVVIGIPGEATIWTLLEREAQRTDTPLRYLESANQIRISDDTRLQLSELAHGKPGAWIRLEHNRIRVDLIDTASVADAAPPSAAFDRRSEHVVINMRSQNLPGHLSPALLVQPRPFWQGDFDEFDADYVAGIDRNERVKLSFEDGELRIPLEDLDS